MPRLTMTVNGVARSAVVENRTLLVPSVFRFTEAEKALSVDFSIAALAGVTLDAEGLNSDIHASAEYRAHAIEVLTRRAMERALSA
jgi:carbon-monoxide dehydrogenase medium subunit